MSERNFGVWLALDAPEFSTNIRLTEILHRHVDGVKAHASAEGELNEKVAILKSAGAKKVWWDRKGHDTPDTIAKVGETACNADVDRMTVHASGGIEMMMGAVEHGPSEIAAITMLTSLTKAEIGLSTGMPVDAAVLLRAQWAAMAGVHNVVCSGEEVEMLNARRAVSKVANQPLELSELKLTVPGSRTITDDMGSQKRSGTAMEILKRGADELVLGSEIWKSADPLDALKRIYLLIAGSQQ